MWKWIGRILYILFVIFLSTWVYSVSYFSKLQAYYDDYIRDHINDNETFLKGVNTLLQTDYIQTSPLLYSFNQNEGDFQLNVSVYAISATENDVRFDGFMIFVNQVSVMHNNEALENPVIKITVTLDQETLLVDGQPSNEGTIQFVPSNPFSFSNLPTIFLFDNARFLEDSETGVISQLMSIAVYYSDGSIDSENRFVYEPRPIFLATTQPSDEIVLGNNKVSDLSIDQSLYQLRFMFADEFPSDEEILLYNLNVDRDSLSAYNFLVWRTMIIYVTFLLLVTYFLFVHKTVMTLIRQKRAQSNPDAPTSKPLFKD